MVPSDGFQGVKPSLMNAPKLDPASRHWREMTANLGATLEAYRASGMRTRRETRRVLDIAMLEVEQQCLEGQALAYLIGRLDGIDTE